MTEGSSAPAESRPPSALLGQACPPPTARGPRPTRLADPRRQSLVTQLYSTSYAQIKLNRRAKSRAKTFPAESWAQGAGQGAEPRGPRHLRLRGSSVPPLLRGMPRSRTAFTRWPFPLARSACGPTPRPPDGAVAERGCRLLKRADSPEPSVPGSCSSFPQKGGGKVPPRVFPGGRESRGWEEGPGRAELRLRFPLRPGRGADLCSRPLTLPFWPKVCPGVHAPVRAPLCARRLQTGCEGPAALTPPSSAPAARARSCPACVSPPVSHVVVTLL